MIPPSFIQDLLARTDIADIVGRHVTLKKAGINYKGLCPFHGEKTPSFIVSPTRQTYHCFGCGVHGNAIGFLMEYAGLGFVDAVRDLAQIQGMPIPEERSTPEEREQAKARKAHAQSITDVLAKASTHWRQELKRSPRAIQYLKGRGLTGEIAARFALGYAPEGWKHLASVFPQYDDPLLVEAGLVIVPDDAGHDGAEARRYDRFRDRIMFPIRSVQGDVIGFGGRVLDKGEPKYLNSPETPVFVKGRELYGLFEARSALRNKGYVIVTEGYMDVVALAQWGYGNAVATLGTACTADHVHKLFRFTDQVVFSFDGDAAGRRAAGRALEASLPHATDTRRISFLFLPAEHDPDSYIRDLGPDAFETAIRQAVPLSRQLIAHAGHDCDLDSAEGRARLLAQAAPLLAQMPDGGLRDQMVQELATQARVGADDVRRRLAQNEAGGQGRRGGHEGRSTGGSEHAPADDWNAAPWPSDADFSGSEAYPDSGSWSPDDERRGGGSRSGQRGPWRGDGRGSRGRWRRDGAGWGRQQRSAPRPLPQAARPLERAAWLLLHRSDLWEQLPPDLQDLLCEQTMPLGAFFAGLDRIVVDQGPLASDALLEALRRSGEPLDEAGHTDDAPWAAAVGVSDDALSALLKRLADFHDVLGGQARVEDLVALIQPLQLQALRDELDLLLQSGELSEAAEARKLELIRQTNALKLEITRQRPISA